MALINCRECGREVSTRARTCPNCGAAPRRTYSLFTGLVVIGLVVWIVSKCMDTPDHATETVTQAAATRADDSRKLGVTQQRPEDDSSLRAECSTTSSPDRFVVDTARVTIDDGTAQDVVLTACPMHGLPTYCGTDWAQGLILNKIRTPLSGNALVADPTGCWVASGANIKFRYFNLETASEHEFSFPAAALRRKLYEWRTGVLSEAKDTVAEAAAPAPAALAAVQPDVSTMSEAEFDAQFKFPETYATVDESKRALAGMVAWYGSHRTNVTPADLLAYRMELLKRHDCLETLANIEAGQKADRAAVAHAPAQTPVDSPATPPASLALAPEPTGDRLQQILKENYRLQSRAAAAEKTEDRLVEGAQPSGPKETAALRSCVNAQGAVPMDARNVAEDRCKEQLAAWRRGCVQDLTLAGKERDSAARCGSELRDMFEAIDKRRGKHADAEPEPKQNLAAMAERFAKGLPLPGMPNLERPVFLKERSPVCANRGSLANPNAILLVLTGTCFRREQRTRVLVHEPADVREYMEAYLVQGVRVSWAPEKMSSENIRHGWVYLESLEN